MSAVTGLPPRADDALDACEDEPLLGRPGDVQQQKEQPIYTNLVTGTAIIAQAGVLLLFALIWSSVFLNPVILFSAHPLLNSAGLLLLTEGILILQPTHTPDQKRTGTWIHFATLNLGLDSLIAGLIVIEYNKFSHNGSHFDSVHAYLGVITYIVLALQALVGITAFFTPTVYGSVDKAKSLYKYHRISGYVILTLSLATVAAATHTTYNVNVLHLRLWAILLSAVLVLVGVLPRVKKEKLGIARRS